MVLSLTPYYVSPYSITKLLEAHGDSGSSAVDKGTTVKTADGEEVDPLGRPVDAAPVTA